MIIKGENDTKPIIKFIYTYTLVLVAYFSHFHAVTITNAGLIIPINIHSLIRSVFRVMCPMAAALY